MTEQPPPVEVFGVRSDGELIPLRPGSSNHTKPSRPPVSPAPPSGPRVSADPERRWELEIGKPNRPGGYSDRRSMSGNREDVVAPVPVLPGPASRALHTGEVFDEPLPGLDVNVDSLTIDTHGSSWDATVTWGRLPRRSRSATLRAYPSRSANLTVLELVPRRRRLIHTGAFIRAGVPAIATLSCRINRVVGVRPAR